jgi:hypothetical protein
MPYIRPLIFDLRQSLPWLYLALGLAQAAHSIKEVLTGLWRWMPLLSAALHNQLGWTPVLVMPEYTFIIANMIIITLMIGFSPIVFLNHTWAWTIATIVAVIETVNGVGHVSMALARHTYFSGCITGVALVLFSVPLWGWKWIFKKEEVL